MEWNDYGSIAGYVAVALQVAQIFIATVNHKRIRSTCCKQQVEVSLDIENTTPPTEKKLSEV